MSHAARRLHQARQITSWPRRDDDEMIRLRDMGEDWAEVGRRLKRPPAECETHFAVWYEYLCDQISGGVTKSGAHGDATYVEAVTLARPGGFGACPHRRPAPAYDAPRRQRRRA